MKRASGQRGRGRHYTLKEHLNEKLRSYRVVIPISLALASAILSAYAVLSFYAKSDRSFLQAISPYVSMLVETQDGLELQRFTTAVYRERGVNITVIEDGEVIASGGRAPEIGRELQEIDADVETYGVRGLTLHMKMASTFLLSTMALKRRSGPADSSGSIRLYNPILKPLTAVIWVALIVFVIGLLTLNALIANIIKTAQRSIAPIKDLESDIIRLKNFEQHGGRAIIRRRGTDYISELENIYQAIETTSSQLKESNEKLAMTKARELTVNTYKKLIHDLHTPVAALKQMIKIINREDISPEKKDFAKGRIAEIAEQVLLQVKASRGNLKLEITPRDGDLNECVRKASGQAQMALREQENISVIEKYDSSIESFCHDQMMLGRAISNIIVNAIEACRQLVEVSVKKLGREISIAISDDGDGVGREDVSLFLQGRGKSHKKNGLGIGLSSANHIVRLHGGRIIYRKSHLGGACFDIRMEV